MRPAPVSVLTAAVSGVLAAALVGVPLPSTGATSTAGDLSATQGLRKSVTVKGIREHLTAFQAIADANNGTRASGTPGYAASVDYVAGRLEASGYDVTVQPFDFTFNADATPAVLQRVAPAPATFVDGVDFVSMEYSGNGDVTGNLTAVDLTVPASPTPSSTSGCEAADFAGFPAGSIALLQRGTCNFSVKALNAEAAGASAAVIFNEGQPGRTAVLGGTLGGPGIGIPVVGTTYALGTELANGVTNGTTGSTVRVRVDRANEVRTTWNVIADTPTGNSHHVVLVGAHLDSVPRGPGINDNGSGAAGILEIAESMAARGITPRNQVRFAFWGGEEGGLLGSTYYVANLSQAQRDDIELNLNFDMIGSPNFVRFVYDGDNSAFPVGPGAAEGPAGSGEIERVFSSYFSGVGLASAPTPFSGRSDYGPFIAVGIPAGGLFTGAEGIKTAEEAATYGGTAGTAYDACYHLGCDTIANVSNTALDQMSDAAAHATLLLAKRNYTKQPLAAPTSARQAALRVVHTGGGPAR